VPQNYWKEIQKIKKKILISYFKLKTKFLVLF